MLREAIWEDHASARNRWLDDQKPIGESVRLEIRESPLPDTMPTTAQAPVHKLEAIPSVSALAAVRSWGWGLRQKSKLTQDFSSCLAFVQDVEMNSGHALSNQFAAL